MRKRWAVLAVSRGAGPRRRLAVKERKSIRRRSGGWQAFTSEITGFADCSWSIRDAEAPRCHQALSSTIFRATHNEAPPVRPGGRARIGRRAMRDIFGKHLPLFSRTQGLRRAQGLNPPPFVDDGSFYELKVRNSGRSQTTRVSRGLDRLYHRPFIASNPFVPGPAADSIADRVREDDESPSFSLRLVSNHPRS